MNAQQDQLAYFLSLFKASSIVDPAATFRGLGMFPSNLQPYTLQQVSVHQGNNRVICGRGRGGGGIVQEYSSRV